MAKTHVKDERRLRESPVAETGTAPQLPPTSDLSGDTWRPPSPELLKKIAASAERLRQVRKKRSAGSL